MTFLRSESGVYPVGIVQEPVIGLIKWLRPKGLKVCSYAEKCAEFINQTLKEIGCNTKALCATEYPRGMQHLKIALKWGTLAGNHVISVVKCNFCSKQYILLNKSLTRINTNTFLFEQMV